jgi:hypothetical protein
MPFSWWTELFFSRLWWTELIMSLRDKVLHHLSEDFKTFSASSWAPRSGRCNLRLLPFARLHALLNIVNSVSALPQKEDWLLVRFRTDNDMFSKHLGRSQRWSSQDYCNWRMCAFTNLSYYWDKLWNLLTVDSSKKSILEWEVGWLNLLAVEMNTSLEATKLQTSTNTCVADMTFL